MGRVHTDEQERQLSGIFAWQSVCQCGEFIGDVLGRLEYRLGDIPSLGDAVVYYYEHRRKGGHYWEAAEKHWREHGDSDEDVVSRKIDAVRRILSRIFPAGHSILDDDMIQLFVEGFSDPELGDSFVEAYWMVRNEQIRESKKSA